jgi:hypothetical protein
LSIVYPHPSPKYGRKYAEVVLQTEPDVNDAAVSNAISQLVANPFKKDAAAEEVNGNSLRLTITREELEFLLRDLVADSYFDREERNGDVQLSVTLGSRSIQKPWDRVASFDQLAQRVRQEYGNRPGRSGAGKAVTAHAELLPPAASDLMAEAPPESARSGKFHATPQF